MAELEAAILHLAAAAGRRGIALVPHGAKNVPLQRTLPHTEDGVLHSTHMSRSPSLLKGMKFSVQY
jgi:hypothetical protein